MASNVSYGRKFVFNSLLSNELRDSSYRIDARYEWKYKDQILSFRVIDNCTMRLGINLNFKENELFSDNNLIEEINVKYRAYYISSYVHCMELATVSNPKSYFDGLVLLCAINNILSKRKSVSLSPLMNRRHTIFRPIDVYCAIRALSRLIIEYNNMLLESQKVELNAAINALILYSLLPEINYMRKRPMYSLLCEIKELQRNIYLAGEGWMDTFPLFKEYEINSLSDATLDYFLDKCSQSQNAFWTGITMRLMIYAGCGIEVDKTEKMNGLIDCIQKYKKDCVNYFMDMQKNSNILLADNYIAIKKIIGKLHKTFTFLPIVSGALHYYQ